mmetsp:Transcript_46639/g.77137  ORF Transcript_46639/g.77137 Transcript_46639/m.77137 type:complete len:342 (+) Transcript_46639:20-1045(+)|eukprot:CAMPEP_0119333958 /NCGR_PEP_ID=MMETSP1333-20130426/86345_1 /TAXON_ID=418940 /ORGANISM="Scyphosphaera apsteinii, Strain RCC1455" /LENGTH=341 /DNA_ID=CAMNT_0007344151 /DNA_START=11 /DNA_END=1036 /DNA_ORIENTATION=-
MNVVLLMPLASKDRASSLRSPLAGAPKLGLGMAALGRPGYINLGHGEDIKAKTVEAMRENAHAVLDAAVEVGVRYIDCARSYGLSEKFVASWLSSRLEAPVIVGSKWGYEYTANWRVTVKSGEAHEVKYHTVQQLTKQHRESTELLPGLALYQIHSATQESKVLEDAEILNRLAALRDETQTVIGLSVSDPQVPSIERATSVTVQDSALFGSVQATFNLLDQSAAGALQAAHEAGMFIIIKEALANGRLTPRASMSARLSLLQAEAAALGTSVDALALAWVMSHDWVDICLSGASTIEQLRSNSDALRLVPLPEAVHRRLSEGLRQEQHEYWAERRALEWN